MIAESTFFDELDDVYATLFNLKSYVTKKNCDCKVVAHHAMQLHAISSDVCVGSV
jgi:hypothetical protein